MPTNLGLCAAAILLALICLLPAKSGSAAPLLAEFGQEMALGGNLNGEACRLRFVKSAANDTDRRTYHLHCEGWTQSSGYVVSFKIGSRFDPKELLSRGEFADQLTSRLAECSPTADSKIAEQSGAVRFCRRRDGG
jgi:hypothetical protein